MPPWDAREIIDYFLDMLTGYLPKGDIDYESLTEDEKTQVSVVSTIIEELQHDIPKILGSSYEEH